ncbi:MAG: hypothetical protein ACK40X_05635 [Armatimonadota bacterium]
MKRCWILSIFSALVATLSFALSREPAQTQWLVSFQRESGGLLSLLRHLNLEAPRITGMVIYTDWGILKPDRYEPIGSQNEREPKVSEVVSSGEKFIIVEGQLKDRNGQPCGLKYRVVHKFAHAEVAMDVTLRAERDFQSMRGFLATMLNFTGATEWFACTQKGWLFAEIGRDGRVFQSAHNPLDTNSPTLGVANSQTGLALVLTLKNAEPEESLDNVFIHANPTGSGGIFLAWCDGIGMREMKIGDEWRISVNLSFTRLDKLVGAAE